MKNSKLTQYGLLIALAMILSYVESLIPVFIAVPGVKLGLANIVAVFAMYRLSVKDAFVISLVRIVLVGITFGNMFGIIYSLAGALLSLVTMALLKKTDKFGVSGVSVAGGVMHNVGQTLVAMAVLETAKLAYYIPVLLIAGTAAGLAIGILAGIMLKKMSKFK